jgi:hypothetical protein
MINNAVPCALPSMLKKLHVVTNTTSYKQLPFIPAMLTSLIYEISICEADLHGGSTVERDQSKMSLEHIVARLSTTSNISAKTSVHAIFTRK